MNFEHRPVLLNETIDNLCIKPGGTYVDGTLGGGGHAYEVVRRLSPQGRFIGIDQDADAIRAAGEKLADYRNVTLIRSNYCNIREELMGNHVTGVDGIVLDLGVSSYQLDTPARGFSYKYDSPLDMRMDQRSDMTAGDIVNGYSQEELYRVIRDYGEERFAKKIAGNIVAAREEKEITSTNELANIVKQSIPMKFRKTMGHPAKQTFQAIRIELNRELDVLEETLDTMIELLNPGGRLCIITFHSLEDRIVKNGFKRNENPCTCPPDFPVCVCGKVSMGRVVTRKPVIPSEEEMNDNPRSKSAKLRVFEKKRIG